MVRFAALVVVTQGSTIVERIEEAGVAAVEAWGLPVGRLVLEHSSQPLEVEFELVAAVWSDCCCDREHG